MINSIKEKKMIRAQLELYASFLRFGLEMDSFKFWDRLLKKIRRRLEINRITTFAYSVENKGLYNDFTPWEKKGNRWYLDRLNKTYWQKYMEWLRLFKDRKMRLNIVAFPGAYGEIPFKRNFNEVHSLLDQKALGFQKKYLRKLCRRANRILGDNWTLRLSNEMGGRHETGKRHQEWYLAIEGLLPIDRIISDNSHSDYPSAYLCEEFGKEEWNRRIWIEDHAFSIIEHLWYRGGEGSPIWEIVLGSGWKKFILSSDGSTCIDENGNFHSPDDPSPKYCPQGYRVPGTGFVNSDKQQMFQFCKQAWTDARRAGKKLIIADLPMEVLILNEDGILEEDYSRLNFGRLRKLKRAWRRI